MIAHAALAVKSGAVLVASINEFNRFAF